LRNGLAWEGFDTLFMHAVSVADMEVAQSTIGAFSTTNAPSCMLKQEFGI
jgi:hypothetical protein